MFARATPSLRIARLVITNFRTFRAPTEIVLSSAAGVADAMPVFHGMNGAGKSNALAALDLFFRVASAWLEHVPTEVKPSGVELTAPWGRINSRSGLEVDHRSWPPGTRDPQVIEVHFENPTLSPLRVTLTPSGVLVALRLEQWTVAAGSSFAQGEFRAPSKPRARDFLKNALETPLGPNSRPLFLLDARRRTSPGIGESPDERASDTPLSPAIADRLLSLATSLEPGETERWRAFVSLIGRFKMLSGREVSVLRIPAGKGDATDLRFEIRGKQILRLSELSSGEQQIVALLAAVLTSRAALVAIEEPEMSLHPENQALVRDVLLEQVKSVLVDQIFLESHVPVFDGPEVIRFTRSPEGDTSVERQRARSDEELRDLARASGAEEQWVTPEGYTRLPADMREALGLSTGGHLWFLPSKPSGRWEAWTAAELDEQLGLGAGATKDT